MFHIGDKVRVAHTGDFGDMYGVVETMRVWGRNRTVLEVVAAGEDHSLVTGPTHGGYASFTFENRNLVLVEREEEPIRKKSVRELISEAKKEIRDNYAGSSRNAVFCVLRENRSNIHVHCGPCHGDLRNRGMGATAIVTLIVRKGAVGYSGTHKQPPYEELLAYYDWLFNRSPYAGCFMYKAAKNALREKCAVLRTDQPANILQGALIATRNTWEFAPNIRIWHRLVEAGVNENLAFILCYCVSENERQLTASGVSRDHISIQTAHMHMQGAKAFVEGTPLRVNEAYNKGGSYEGVTEAFLGRGGNFFAHFYSLFQSFGDKKKTGINPFVKAKPRQREAKTMTMEQFVKFVKANEDKFIQEV